VWLIVPAAVGHDTIANLLQVLDSGDILLDGRNSEPETFAKEAAKVIAADVRAAHASREGFVMACRRRPHAVADAARVGERRRTLEFRACLSSGRMQRARRRFRS
jgi:hypothetical protein